MTEEIHFVCRHMVLGPVKLFFFLDNLSFQSPSNRQTPPVLNQWLWGEAMYLQAYVMFNMQGRDHGPGDKWLLGKLMWFPVTTKKDGKLQLKPNFSAVGARQIANLWGNFCGHAQAVLMNCVQNTLLLLQPSGITGKHEKQFWRSDACRLWLLY